MSNAFKFTFEGEVAVRVWQETTRVVLEVADTGICIPESELPHIFERFHRVPGAVGRVQEGSGIGLSLVRELVGLHGGRVEVASEPGRGSTFRVEIPKGYAHLPEDAIAHEPTGATELRNARAHAAEVARWTPSAEPLATTPDVPATDKNRARVLVVDDNAALREYMAGLLAPYHDVQVACDGRQGVEAAKEHLPDIVLSDVMMPRLDGFGLVQELRADPRTAALPIVLLSARAGEESAVEGLDSGADDYLVKPFSARELLARVRTHVGLARTRRAWIAQLEAANAELEAFSYSVSHDLRGPIGHVRGFAELLQELEGAGLSDRGRVFLQEIHEASVRMEAITTHLLRLAHLSRSPLVRQPTDLTAMARDIARELQLGAPERRVDWRIADGVTADCDAGLVEVMLQNLLSNAFKYSSKQAEPVVEFGVAADGITLFVRDNGAGFDPQQAERLFTPFVRLHGQAEFPGTGVGLSTVQRIVHRHGGRIWAEGAVGQGAQFSFVLAG